MAGDRGADSGGGSARGIQTMRKRLGSCVALCLASCLFAWLAALEMEPAAWGTGRGSCIRCFQYLFPRCTAAEPNHGQ